MSSWRILALLGLAACSGGCVHERSDQAREHAQPEREPMTFTELESRLWPTGTDAWIPLAEHELVALEQLVCLLIAHSVDGRLDGSAALGLAALAGVELHAVALEHEGRTHELWVIVEPLADRRGRGSYLIRRGPLERELEWIIQAPHSRFDRHTGALALQMFIEDDARSARALFVNSAHRYRQLDGSREPHRPATANPADAAHNPEHPLARVTAASLARFGLAVVQLHGFERRIAAGDPELILSSGADHPSSASTAILVNLREGMAEHAVGHYGLDTDRLGGRSNVQGRSARAAQRCFVHIELSEPLRKQLLAGRELRRRFASAVLGTHDDQLRGGCR